MLSPLLNIIRFVAYTSIDYGYELWLTVEFE